MDPRLLRHYNQELQHLREMGAEFALQFLKIAARLRMDGIEVGRTVQPGYWEQLGYDVDAWIGASNGRSDEPVF